MALFRIVRCTLVALALTPLAAHAEVNACRTAGLTETECREPLIGSWTGWRFVLGETQGPLRDNEEAALADAVTRLKEIYGCGLSYVARNLSYTPTARQWSWVNREEAVGLYYVGLPDDGRENCTGDIANERKGTVRISRERKIKCPKHYNWLIRDEKIAVCVPE